MRTSTTRPYPLLVDEREAVRETLRLEAIAAAEREAMRMGRSIKCAQFDNHAPEGCQNKGDGCLCRCHDVAAIQ